MPIDIAIWLSLAINLLVTISLTDFEIKDPVIRRLLTISQIGSTATLVVLFLITASNFFFR